jgi:hypothetical protein
VDDAVVVVVGFCVGDDVDDGANGGGNGPDVIVILRSRPLLFGYRRMVSIFLQQKIIWIEFEFYDS